MTRTWKLWLSVGGCLLVSLTVTPSFAARSGPYRALQSTLSRGWNTWSNSSLLTHVFLPNGAAVSLALKPTWVGGAWLPGAIREHNKQNVRPGLRSDDGSYTSLVIDHAGVRLDVQSATAGNDLLLLVSAHLPKDRVPNLVIDAGVLFGRPGYAEKVRDRLVIHTPGRVFSVGSTQPLIEDGNVPLHTPYLVVRLGDQAPFEAEPAPEPERGGFVDVQVGFFTGRRRTLSQVKQHIEAQRAQVVARHAKWGDLSASFAAMQTVLAWNTVYDAENDRVIAPVSRSWSDTFSGHVLFCWDTYFSSAMLSLFNKQLAYANAIEMTKAITPGGFVPNYAKAYGTASFDRSQPPVGSRVILDLWKRHHDNWLLAEVYPMLLRWNEWWPKERQAGAWLAFGSNVQQVRAGPVDKQQIATLAKYESGLDNSPIYDRASVDERGVFAQSDVGLTSLYVMDCEALAEIATALGRTNDAAVLRERADKYRAAVNSLWQDARGIYMDRDLAGHARQHLSPTNFYPLLARAPSPAQVDRMATHYFDDAEFHGPYVMPSIARSEPGFKDNDYWRGRIWAPMNYLVYLGLRNYDSPQAKAMRQDLVRRSRALLEKGWTQSRGVYENYNAITGDGGDVKSSDGFYHWGALLGFLSLIDKEE